MDIAEPTITCPYNKAHSIISSRMQFHLSKCRLQYPNAEKAVCPFNSTHVVNKVELEIHQLVCDDRIVLDSFTCKVGSSAEIKVDVAKIEPLEIRGDECWDEETMDGSVLERVHESSKNKPALHSLIGAPRSERKAFRTHERLRIQRVLDNQVAENKSGGNGKKKENHPQGANKDAESANGQVEDIDEINGRRSPKRVNAYQENKSGGNGKKKENHLLGPNKDAESAKGKVEDIDEINGRRSPKRVNAYQATEPENAYGGAIQKTSAHVSKDRKNPWHTSKALTNMNGGNDNTKEIKNDIKPITLLSNNNKHQNVRDLKGSGYANAKSLGNMKIEETVPARARRDPTNPWGSYKLPPSMMSSYGDQSDFPMLPVASRGRGRDRMAAIRTK